MQFFGGLGDAIDFFVGILDWIEAGLPVDTRFWRYAVIVSLVVLAISFLIYRVRKLKFGGTASIHQYQLGLPWNLLTQEEFVRFCAALLGKLEIGITYAANYQRFKGVVWFEAWRAGEASGSERWIVVCDNLHQGELDFVHIRELIDRAKSIPNKGSRIVITTATSKIAWAKVPKKIEMDGELFYFWLIDRSILETLVSVNPDLITSFFGNKLRPQSYALPETAAKLSERLDRVWSSPGDEQQKIRKVVEEYTEFSDDSRLDQVSPYEVMYINQFQDVTYFKSGFSRSVYKNKVLNLGDQDYHYDLLTLDGKMASDLRSIEKLRVSDQFGKDLTSSSDFILDMPNHKVLRVPFENPLRPARTYEYSVHIDWPYELPLTGLRHYFVPIYRYTLNLRVCIHVPVRSVRDAVVFMTDRERASFNKLTTLQPKQYKSGWRIDWSLFQPKIDCLYQILFTVE